MTRHHAPSVAPERLRALDDAIDRIELFSGRLMRPDVLTFVLDDAALIAQVMQLLGFKRIIESMRDSGLLESSQHGQVVLMLAEPLAAMVEVADAALSARFGEEKGASA